MSKKKILLVDDNPANLTACKKILKDLYEVFPAPSAEKLFEILKHVIPDLILLDVEMPVMNGYDTIRMLRKNSEYKDIPVIFLSAMDDAQSEIEGLELGAVDYIHKPFVSSLLIRRIETHIAVVEGKKELLALNKSLEEFLKPTTDGTVLRNKTGEEAFKMLLNKSEILVRMGHEIRTPLNTIIDMIKTALKMDDVDKIRHCLGRADIETRLIQEILDEILDISKIE